jgi:CelD/BcsL family acetyltransferase involved in cellulose biosynthesis
VPHTTLTTPLTRLVATQRLVELSYDDPRWSEFAKRHPSATICHSPAWVRLIAETYRLRGFALGVASGDRIVGLIPMIETGGVLRRKRWVSLPFTDVCPPLLDHEVDEWTLVSLLESARSDAGVFAIDIHASIRDSLHKAAGFEHVLPLGPDAATVLQGSKPKNRQLVRQAIRAGLRPRIATSPEDLVRTYFAMHVVTRRRQGVPCQPRSFFERLWEQVIEPGDGFVLLAEHDGSPAGGAVFLSGSPTLVYKYSASDPSLLRLRPNNLVISTAIEWGCQHGCTALHFGRTDATNTGLRSFKSEWGAEERQLVYSRLGSLSVRGRRTEPGAALSFAIRNSPPIVCRALGSILYRFAA